MLEALIQELIESLNANTAALSSKGSCCSETVKEVEAPKRGRKPASEKVADVTVTVTPPSTATVEVKPDAPAESPEPTKEEIVTLANDYLAKGGAVAEIKKLNKDVLGGLVKISDAAGTPNGRKAIEGLNKLIEGLSSAV